LKVGGIGRNKNDLDLKITIESIFDKYDKERDQSHK
jgi:hypothetical protein